MMRRATFPWQVHWNSVCTGLYPQLFWESLLTLITFLKNEAIKAIRAFLWHSLKSSNSSAISPALQSYNCLDHTMLRAWYGKLLFLSCSFIIHHFPALLLFLCSAVKFRETFQQLMVFQRKKSDGFTKVSRKWCLWRHRSHVVPCWNVN